MGTKPGDTDILIAGAGPTGLAAALMLGQAGYRTTVISPPPRGADHRTAALMAGSVAFLDRLGAWQPVAGDAASLRSLRIVDATDRLIRAPEVLFHASEIALDAFGYNVANRALTAALETLCDAHGVERVAGSVASVGTGSEAGTVVLDTGATCTARLIVAADGRRSQVRESIGIGAREWRYDQAALVANIAHGLPHFDTSTEFHTRAGPFTLVPLSGSRSSLVWVDRPAEAARRRDLPPAALAAEIESRSASLLGKVELDGPVQVFPLAGMGVARFSGERCVLIGEAAHVFPPIGAQGLNLGLRDVAALGEVLRGNVADPGGRDRLAAYDRARRADTYTRTAAIDALNRSLLTGFLPLQAARGLGFFLLDRIPALRRAVMREGVTAGAATTP